MKKLLSISPRLRYGVAGAMLFAFALGCHAQLPPSTASTVKLTWIAPAANGGSAYAYVVSRASVATATTPCPATTGTAYTPLNTSAPVSSTTFTDNTPPSGYVCYIVQTTQDSLVSVPSSPSNNGISLAVAPLPLAPTNVQ